MTESQVFPNTFPAGVLVDGLEPGQAAVVIARAGVGKSSVLIQAALACLIRGGEVLHVSAGQTVQHVKRAYDDMLYVIHERFFKSICFDSMCMCVERGRHIHCCKNRVFSAEKLERTISFLPEEFTPSAVMVDGMDLKRMGGEALVELQKLAQKKGFFLWFSALSHRTDPEPPNGCLPVPLDETEKFWDSVFALKPVARRTVLDCLKKGVRLFPCFGDPGSEKKQAGLFLDPVTNMIVSDG